MFVAVMKSQTVRSLSALWFTIKFFILATWYKCTKAGNIIQRTGPLWWTRFTIDLVLYVAIVYSIMLELVYIPYDPADSTVTNAGGSASI